MVHETLQKIEARLAASPTLSPENKEALENLLRELKAQIDVMDDAQAEKAESIAGFTESGAREALRQEPDPELLDSSLDGLRKSVREFEASHPKLTQVVNNICHQLSNLGI